ncbi:MAG: restriction endonuclease subunit S [Candidatus Omnitrophica bacterium]|nr:restriction endonuclease subunit S [Candidatus Omnitrophota bacterium]
MMTTIKDLFEVSYGDTEYESKANLDEGNTILISSKGDDNGVYGFYDIPVNYKAPYITIPRTGTIGQAFLQLTNSTANSDCLILIPKKKFSVEQLLQVVLQIRLNKWKYKYGRKITPKRIEQQEIILENLKVNFDKMVEGLTPKEKAKQKIQENKNVEIMKVKDLCEIKKKTAIPQNAMNLNGNVPYVTTSSMNNGVSQFADEEPNFEGKCLSVAMNGSVGEVFFQIDDFITSGDNAVLTIKEGYNPYLLLFIGTLIRNHQWRYNYYRKMSLDKLKNLELPMPMKNGKVDLEYIEKIVKNAYGFEEVKEYLE